MALLSHTFPPLVMLLIGMLFVFILLLTSFLVQEHLYTRKYERKQNQKDLQMRKSFSEIFVT